MEYSRSELVGVSWYNLLHWDSIRTAYCKHQTGMSLAIIVLYIFIDIIGESALRWSNLAKFLLVIRSHSVGSGAIEHGPAQATEPLR